MSPDLLHGSEDERLELVSTLYGPTYAYKGDMITKQLKRFGAHTRPELAMLLSFVRPGDAVFDIGAHIGTFTIPIAQKVGPAGRVLAVEGFPPTAEVLERNVRLADVADRVVVECLMLGESGETYEASFNSENTGATRYEVAGPAPAQSQPGTSLDSLVDKHFRPSVVKLDIEGFEYPALKGAERLLSERPVLYIEVSTEAGARTATPIDNLEQLLRGHGYLMFRNIGPRNAPNDEFKMARMESLSEGGGFFDVVCVHAADGERLLTA